MTKVVSSCVPGIVLLLSEAMFLLGITRLLGPETLGDIEYLTLAMLVPLPAAIVGFIVWCLGDSVQVRIRASRYAKGLCGVCRYNLTGNVSGVCPECGTRL